MYRTFIIIISTIFISNCNFYSFKGSIPAHIKSIVISPIINNTSEYTVATLLDEKFTSMMLLENILDIVKYENADSKLDITITSISDKPNIFTIDNDSGYEIVNEWKIMIQVKIKWFDLIKNIDIVNKSITEWSTYNLGINIGDDKIDNDLDGLIDSEDNDEFGDPREFATTVAVNKIAEDVLNEIMTSW